MDFAFEWWGRWLRCNWPVGLVELRGDKSLLAMTLANIVARMERSEIRDSCAAGPGLRFAPSGLQPS